MSLNYNYFSLKGFTENGKLLMSITIKNEKLHLYRATSAKRSIYLHQLLPGAHQYACASFLQSRAEH